MRSIRIATTTLLAGLLCCVGGCQTAGPVSIGLGRDHYNHIIQSTSIQQTMSNIVRVYLHEQPMFMDVTEVDASLSFGGSLTGAVTGIGAKKGTTGGTLAGEVGSGGGALQYSETPTIRYQPLLGQPLVAQLVTPVSVDALGLLYDSLWDVGPLLDLSSAYLTLDIRQFYPALNTISELSHREALELAATKSTLTEAEEASAASGEDKTASGGSSKAPASSVKSTAVAKTANNDALMIYLRPFRQYESAENWSGTQRIVQLWIRLLRVYLGSQPPFTGAPDCASTYKLTVDAAALKDWDVHISDKFAKLDDKAKNDLLQVVRRCVPTAIELRVVPIPLHGAGKLPDLTLASHAPVLRTYSALGILKNVTERPSPKIEFVTPQQYQQIRGEPWNDDDETLSFYTLLSSDLDSYNCPETRRANGGCDNPLPASLRPVFSGGRLETWIKNSAGGPSSPTPNGSSPSDAAYYAGLQAIERPGEDVLSNEYILLNSRLGTLRRYILIIVDDKPPLEAVYASYSARGKWYHIAIDDTVSQKNFQLLSLFMTIMAVPPATQPLSPVINVGSP